MALFLQLYGKIKISYGEFLSGGEAADYSAVVIAGGQGRQIQAATNKFRFIRYKALHIKNIVLVPHGGCRSLLNDLSVAACNSNRVDPPVACEDAGEQVSLLWTVSVPVISGSGSHDVLLQLYFQLQ